MRQIEINNKTLFTNELKKLYLDSNFGSFNKSELEELFIYLLWEYGNLKKLSNFEISIALHIPESRVRAIMYRSRLKYCEYSEANVRNDFFDILSNKKYEIVSRGKDSKESDICITIEQQYLKEALEAKIKEAGKAINGNFYKETLVLSSEAFSNLIVSFFPPGEVEAAQKELKKKIKKAEKGFSVKETIMTFLTEKGLQVGIAALATLITGGNFAVGAFAAALVEELKLS